MAQHQAQTPRLWLGHQRRHLLLHLLGLLLGRRGALLRHRGWRHQATHSLAGKEVHLLPGKAWVNLVRQRVRELLQPSVDIVLRERA